MVYDFSTVPTHLETFHRIASSSDYDQNAAFLTSASYHHQYGQHAYNSMKYTEPTPDPTVFKGFVEVPHMHSTMRLGSLKDMVEEEGALQFDGFR